MANLQFPLYDLVFHLAHLLTIWARHPMVCGWLHKTTCERMDVRMKRSLIHLRTVGVYTFKRYNNSWVKLLLFVRSKREFSAITDLDLVPVYTMAY